MDPVRIRTARLELIEGVVAHAGPGGKLPAEASLARLLGVSRNTLREALRELEVRGAVRRVWGIGTFVTTADVMPYSLADLVSVRTLIVASGHGFRQRSTVPVTVCPPADVRAELLIGETELTWYTERTYDADGRPIMAVTEYLRQSVGGVSLDAADVGEDMLAYLDGLGVGAASADMRIVPQIASDGVAGRLGIAPGTPLLRTWSTTVCTNGEPVAYSTADIDASRFDFKIRRTRRPD